MARFRVIVRDSAKTALEAAGATGVAFRPIVLERMVRLDWQYWGDDFLYPGDVHDDELDDEPGDYIDAGRPDAKLAAEVGPLWELVAFECRRRGVPVGVNFFNALDDDDPRVHCDAQGVELIRPLLGDVVDCIRERPLDFFFSAVERGRKK